MHRKIFDKITVFFKQNSFTVNILLFLGLFTFLVIGIDLDSELAVQKDEIDAVVATLTNSLITPCLEASNFLIINPPLIGFLSDYELIPSNAEVIDPHSGRSPPL
jgi:hypothetical protein